MSSGHGQGGGSALVGGDEVKRAIVLEMGPILMSLAKNPPRKVRVATPSCEQAKKGENFPGSVRPKDAWRFMRYDVEGDALVGNLKKDQQVSIPTAVAQQKPVNANYSLGGTPRRREKIAISTKALRRGREGKGSEPG